MPHGNLLMEIKMEHKKMPRCLWHRGQTEAQNFHIPPYGDNGFVHIVRMFYIVCNKIIAPIQFLAVSRGLLLLNKNIRGRWQILIANPLYAEERSTL